MVSLSTCGQSVYLWSVCLHQVSLSTCGQSTSLVVSLHLVSLSTCGQSVYLWSVYLTTCGQSVYLWSVCLPVVSLHHLWSVYIWSVCLPVASLSTCGQSVYLWSVCLLVVSIHVVSLSTCGQSTCGLFTCGQSVYLWSVYIWSVCLLVMMAEKDHHCTETNHRVKLRCKVTMQSYDAKLRCEVQIKLCIVTLHLCNFAFSLFFLNLSIIDLFIRKWYLNVKHSVPDVILKFEDIMTIIYGIKLTLF